MAREDGRFPFRFLKHIGKGSACRSEEISGAHGSVDCGGRAWEGYYRRRWQYDKKVRSTHGVNCTGSCSWDVYVKDGMIVFDTQRTDYPDCGPDSPDHEPRGCPRGASYSWYTYSPVRVKYPYVRAVLLSMWREAVESTGDPVKAWASIAGDPEKRKKYQQARGKGGLVRVSWDEAATLAAAALVHTIGKFGPDRVFGFSPIPAMSMVCYASGARFLSLIGASMISFYDWYADLPPASPQVWGEQTDVPESADWFDAAYMIVWGTNLPMTRTPDAHFFTEARYRGARVAAVAPDYAEYVKFADTWLPAKAGTDAALAMAMTFVVFKEYYIDRPCHYFVSYAKTYTDLPFAVVLDPGAEFFTPGRFLRGDRIAPEIDRGEWKTVYFDSRRGKFVIPNGSIGFRWDESGRWNLKSEDGDDGGEADPLLSFAGDNDGWVSAGFPVFAEKGARVRIGRVPVKIIRSADREISVTTVFDLMAAHLGIDRGQGGDVAKDYDDPVPYTPAWQEKITGVSRKDALRVAREFADTAEKTRGKAMIFLGAGTNHWFHSDTIYRSILNLTTLCGCQGVNGGGWAHYVGQEKVRPLAGWSTIAFGLDWTRPPRLQNGTSFYYFASGQWRYETLSTEHLASPVSEASVPRHPADCNLLAARLGWLPSYPQFNQNPLDICSRAEADGARTDGEIIARSVEAIRKGDLKFALEDPEAPENLPRILFLWRANLLGASGKGHEYFLKHLLGARHSVFNTESAFRPEEVRYREGEAEGKLDLLVTLEIRMSTSALYADMVLPAAGWYEMHDISSTDMHTFIHPFNPAIDPPWETRTNWDQFAAIAEKFSQLAEVHLGTRKDLVAIPLLHDTIGEIAQPEVPDRGKKEAWPVPGKTLPNLMVVRRDYPDTHAKMTALGPLAAEAMIGAKGILWKATEEVAELSRRLGTKREGAAAGRPSLDTPRQVAEAILCLSPETNGFTAMKSWADLEKRTGLSLSHLSLDAAGRRLTFADLDAQPRRVNTSPIWSGIESEGRRYSPFVLNVEEKIPFRTLTGRAQFYQDHLWMRHFGEALPVFRPPLVMDPLGTARIDRPPGKELVLNYLTPHSKWSIHSTYSDTLPMLTLFRGGEAIWLNDEDAAEIDVRDNDWLECFNVNGVVMAKAVVSHRIPRGKAFMYHAQERLINTPGSKISGQRGGTHNSVTRILMKPTQMIGGYAQLSYGFNYYGPTGAQRDENIVVRKAGEVDWYED
jgi:nitrate reductase alpha subunit